MKVAIIIGHDKRSPGAYSNGVKTSEYLYNSEVAAHLSEVADIYKRPLGPGYKTQMEILAKELNPKKYDLVAELHFNAFNKTANGCETVGFKGNIKIKLMGEIFCETISAAYGIQNRGHKFSEVGGRGYWFLKLMDAPAIILEPFFGDHPESEKFNDSGEYACYIKEWLLKIQM